MSNLCKKEKNHDKDESFDWFMQMRDIAVNVYFTQMSTRKGIQGFVQLAVAAMLKEYKQLNNIVVLWQYLQRHFMKWKRREHCVPSI